MRERDLLALEFDKVLQLLADCALSSAGRAACLALKPQVAEPLVKEDSEQTWQCFRLVEEHLSLPLGPFPDIRPTCEQADHGGAVLEGQKAPRRSGRGDARPTPCQVFFVETQQRLTA